MASILNDLRTFYLEDSQKQEQGAAFYPFKDHVNSDYRDSGFYVRRYGTTEAIKETKEIRDHIYGFAPKTVDHNKIFAHWLVDKGVTGWFGCDDQGELTRTKKVELFLDEGMYISLNDKMAIFATSYKNYLHDSVEGDIENVKKN